MDLSAGGLAPTQRDVDGRDPSSSAARSAADVDPFDALLDPLHSPRSHAEAAAQAADQALVGGEPKTEAARHRCLRDKSADPSGSVARHGEGSGFKVKGSTGERA